MLGDRHADTLPGSVALGMVEMHGVLYDSKEEIPIHGEPRLGGIWTED